MIKRARRLMSGRVLHAYNIRYCGLGANYDLNYDARFVGIGRAKAGTIEMRDGLWESLCSPRKYLRAKKKNYKEV